MRKVMLLFISMALVCFATVAAEVPAGGQEAAQQVETAVSPAGLVVEPVIQGPGQILHLGIVIHIVNREQPLWAYKQICEDEVLPAFLNEMKEQDPELAKTIAERIVVQVRQPTDTIWVYIKDAFPARVDYAPRLGEMAVRRFNALDQAKRVQLMGQLTKEKNDLEAKHKESEKQFRSLERYVADTVMEKDLLRQQLSSMKNELTQAELKRAELETKLSLLDRKAAEVKDTVSSEQIAALEKAAQELEMQIQEQSGDDAVTRCKIILRQKEEEFQRVSSLHERSMVSEAEMQKAQAELELSRADYDRAQRIGSLLRDRLAQVREDLKKAKEEFSKTGGLALATVIAEKTLECESELASVQGKTESLAKRIAETERHIAEYRSREYVLQEEKAKNEKLQRDLADLVENEKQLDRRIRAGVDVSKSPERYCEVGGYRDIGEEQPGAYEVVGEVKKPGTFKMAARTTLLQAVAAAGGLTANADAENVVVLRAAKREAPAPGASWDVQRHVVDCTAMIKGESPDDFILQPDDTVIVPGKEAAN
ncbi:MAG: SLBB domain-containing protein [bacterium]|nr:SLBB domain-containing protein [bacterium]